MPNGYSVFPDAEAAVSTALRTAGFRCYSSIPKKAPQYPLIRIARVGGTPLDRHSHDVADLQLDVYGTTKSEARLYASQARTAVHGAESSTVALTSGDAWISGVQDISGLMWLPDTSNVPINRYVLNLRVFLHAV